MIKSGFKDASIETLRKTALKLLDGFISKKINSILE